MWTAVTTQIQTPPTHPHTHTPTHPHPHTHPQTHTHTPTHRLVCYIISGPRMIDAIVDSVASIGIALQVRPSVMLSLNVGITNTTLDPLTVV
jgi:hypothetical protein